MHLRNVNGFVFPVCLLSLFGITSLFGHAILLAAVPAANQVISGTHTPVRLRFNSRIDAKRSRIVLITADGKQITLDIDKQSTADTLSSDARSLQCGSQILRWQVLAHDGHITRG